MLQEMKIYGKLIRMNFLSGLEYRGWWMMVAQTLLVVATDPISTVLMFARFGSIGEWTFERILIIYAIAVTAFGLAECLCRGFDYFPWKMIRSGGFDRLMLRPRSLIIQVAGSYFHIHRLARVAAGFGVIIWCLMRLEVTVSVVKLIILALALLGGLCMYSGVFIMSSGIAFFSTKGLEWIYIFTNASYQVTRCPLEYMPRMLRNVFTFFLPMLVISYYPASVICGWGASVFAGLLAFPVGLAFLGASILVWRIGVKHYRSTGS